MPIDRPARMSSSDRVFEAAADLFSMLSAPSRLRIVCELCDGERNVSDLLERIGLSQSNVSQHLGVLYRGGVLGRRRSGSRLYYRIVSERVRLLCDAICTEGRAGVQRPRRAAGAA